jgi:hypothetical protein
MNSRERESKEKREIKEGDKRGKREIKEGR